MTATMFGHGGPWTEQEYLALGETPDRIELIDGSLHVAAAGTPRHQYVCGHLVTVFSIGDEPRAFRAVNVRLRPGRIVIPDLVVADGNVDLDEPVLDAAAVRLVGEVASPCTATVDTVLKPALYAAAGIPWYLLVEQETGALHLYRLDGDHHVEHSVTSPGQVLRLTDPVTVDIRPEDLLPRR